MSDDPTQNTPQEPEGTPQPQTETSPPDKTPEEIIAELTAERDKWKAFSRQNEDKYKAASQERDRLKEAQMTEAEKALEQARAEGRNSALSELGTELAQAEMAAAAAKTGAQLPDTQYLNIGSFLGADGRPNKEAIEAFVSSLPKPSPFPPIQGAGTSGAGSDSFTSMDPDELANYISGGSYI